MTADVLIYRLYRLRRLIVAAVLPPLLVVLVIATVKPALALVLLPVAILGPLANVVFYPRVTGENLTVSLALALCLALVATIGPDIGIFGIILRLLGLVVLFALVLTLLSGRISGWLSGGEAQSIVVRAKARSKLAAEELRAGLCYFPGRSDPAVQCGPLDQKRQFAVVKKLLMPIGSAKFAGATMDIELTAAIVEQTPTSHEVSVRLQDAEPDDPWNTMRHEFEPLRRGTKVTYQETAIVSSREAWSMWLLDYHADYLAADIERAEGRSPRANYSFNTRLLLVDLLGLVFPGSKVPPMAANAGLPTDGQDA
jgi:hypothetical protein